MTPLRPKSMVWVIATFAVAVGLFFAGQFPLLGVFGLDVDLGRKAREALAQAETPSATVM